MANAKMDALQRRIQKLEERIQRQKFGPEVETSKKILVGLMRKYELLKTNSSSVIPEASSDTQFQGVSEEQLIERLGAIYWIFGSSYEEIFSYKKYRIDFLKILPTNTPQMVMVVQVNIYENEQLFAEHAEITFWKGFSDSVEVDDLGFSSDYSTKYANCSWFEKLQYNLARTWNSYFKDVPLITAKESGLLECHSYGRY